MDKQTAVGILWDYMQMHQEPTQSDCIIGFGCYNEDVARRAAQLYHQGMAPFIVFTGGLGRNTASMWKDSEAERFKRIAVQAGVPEDKILKEERAANSGENFIYTRQLLSERGFSVNRVIGVQKPYMERRLFAAFPIYWPEVSATVTSWQQTYDEYISGLSRWGRGEEETISMIVGDFQRIDCYAERGYQIPQEIPSASWEAFHYLVNLGYTRQLVR